MSNAEPTLAELRAAAAGGDPCAMDSLATALTDPRRRVGRGSRPALDEALVLYRRAFCLGRTVAAYNLAVTYQNLGRHRQAVVWFRTAAAAGEVDALLPLARAELAGLGTRRDVPAAIAKLRRVAAASRRDVCPFDSEQAMLTLAQIYLEGWLVRRDFRRHVAWLRRAEAFGSAAAAGLLRDHGELTSR